MDECRQAIVDMCNESRKTGNVYGNGWQCGLNALDNTIVDALAAPAAVLKAAFDVSPASAPDFQAGSGF